MSLNHLEQSSLRARKSLECTAGAKVLTPKITSNTRQQTHPECSSNSSNFSDKSSQNSNYCICQSCCKPFQIYSNSKAHIASERAQVKKWCSECRVKATNVRNLSVCTLCGEITSKLSDHEASHYRDKDGANALFECPKCCRSFFQFNELKKHLKDNHSDRRTTPSKSVNCPICSTKFYSRHQRDQHFVEHFKATFDAIWQTICNMHQNLGEVLQSNQCPICGHIMINKRSLKRHVINRHLIHIFKSHKVEPIQHPNFNPNCELLPSNVVDILINNSMANYKEGDVLKVFKMRNDGNQDEIVLDGIDEKDCGKKKILLCGIDEENNEQTVDYNEFVGNTELVDAKVNENSQQSKVDFKSGLSASSGLTKSDVHAKQVDLKGYAKTTLLNDKRNSSEPLNSKNIHKNSSSITENSNTSAVELNRQDVCDSNHLSHHSPDTQSDDAMDIRYHLISLFMDENCEWPRCVECEYRFERMFDFEIHLIKKHIPSVFSKQKL